METLSGELLKMGFRFEVFSFNLSSTFLLGARASADFFSRGEGQLLGDGNENYSNGRTTLNRITKHAMRVEYPSCFLNPFCSVNLINLKLEFKNIHFLV